MQNPTTNLVYSWEQAMEPLVSSMRPVSGGFTSAHRGIVSLPDGTEAFVKIATDEMTRKWLAKEIAVYRRLNAAGYAHIPELLAVNDDGSGMAIAYLPNADFTDTWDHNKLTAVMDAREALRAHVALFRDDPMFRSDDVATFDDKWPNLLNEQAIVAINAKLHKLQVPLTVTMAVLRQMAETQHGWSLAEDTLIHEDIRADNFGYDPQTKSGKLVDWNWLCIGDDSLDVTPLFINMYINGFNPYEHYPDKYDPQVLRYLVSFWLDAILHGDEDSGSREYGLRAAQARNVVACFELLEDNNLAGKAWDG